MGTQILNCTRYGIYVTCCRINDPDYDTFFLLHGDGYEYRYNVWEKSLPAAHLPRTTERPRNVQVSRRSLQTRSNNFLCACIPARTRSRSIGALLHASKHHQVSLLPLVHFKYVFSSNLIGGVHRKFTSNELTCSSCSYCIKTSIANKFYFFLTFMLSYYNYYGLLVYE